MSNQIAEYEAELKEYRLQLETVQSGLQADPDNVELQNLKKEIEEVITLTETAIGELKPASAPAPVGRSSRPSPPLVKEKWSKENHPAYQAGYRKPEVRDAPVEAEKPVVLAVNDSVLAKWKSGDKAMWPAKITSITGSSSKPVYIVKFQSDGTTETVFSHEIKALPKESRKRKADGPPGTPTVPTTSFNPSVISAAADIDPTLASQAKKEPSKVGDGPIRPPKVPRKVKANKELEAGKSKWQDFTMKGKSGKSGKKESMFRTPDGINARVGFTGSGQQMRKDPTRSRHIYQQNNEDE